MNSIVKSESFLIILFFLIFSCSSPDRSNRDLPEWYIKLKEFRDECDKPGNDRVTQEINRRFRQEYPAIANDVSRLFGPEELEKFLRGVDNVAVCDQLIRAQLNEMAEHKYLFDNDYNQLSNLSGENATKSGIILFDRIYKFRKALDQFEKLHPASLLKVIDDIKIKSPEWKSEKYFKAVAGLAEEIDETERLLKGSMLESTEQLTGFLERYEDFKRQLLLSNPLLKKYPVVFVTRNQYKSDHHNTATLFHTNETNTEKFEPGGALKIIDLKKGGRISTLLETSEGVIRDPEVSSDGKQIIFSMRRNIEDDYHIYEIDADGRNLRQLTAAPGVADIDPQYLPNGDIVFTSTREPKYCMCNIHIMGNLFRMNPDGSNITQLGKSSLFEGHSTILPDGKILYDRWEYVDRNFGDAQGLWTMNPDGTNQAVYFGNNSNSPGGYIDARPIPGTDKVITIMGSCHDRPWGALGIINREKGVDEKEAVELTWPASAHDLIGQGNWDTFKRVRPLYEDPYPLDDTYFLCSRLVGPGEQMGIFLIDIFGNEQLIYNESPGCYDPITLKPYPQKNIITDKYDFKAKTGKLYVQDVYEGTHMQGVEQGSVKYLRVVESVEKRSWTEPAWGGQGVHRPAMNWHSFECKRILGTVPVEEDGSVYVEVPADIFFYFQLLDEEKMMIQSMRSGTMLRPGEVLGCIGCHEDRRMAPAAGMSKFPIALERPPQKLEGWFGEPRTFSFMKEVQPVFDKHCAKCHDFGKKAGDKLLLASDRNPYFNASYIDMWMKDAITAIGAGPAEIQQAYSWGSHPSKIIKKIRAGHKNVSLTFEEMERLTTWIDINAVYYSDFISAYPDNPVGRSPVSKEDLDRLGELTKVNFNTLGRFQRLDGPQISFERPELSPCLKNISDKNSENYKEALAIIEKGREELMKNPRLDMNGFKPSETDRQRLDKYQFRRDEEMNNRKAAINGEKHFDREAGITEVSAY